MSVDAGVCRRFIRSPGSPIGSCQISADGGEKGRKSHNRQTGSQGAARLAGYRAGLVSNGASAGREVA